MEKKRRPWLKYVIALLAGALISLALLAWYGAFSGDGTDPLTLYRRCSDAFFTAGALILCAGALMFVSRNGAFDAITYSVRFVFGLVRRREPWEKREAYHDYKARLASKEKPPCFFLIAVGAFYILIAGIFTWQFLRNGG